MDKFRALQVFVAVADQRGFAAAARSLNMSPPAVSQQIRKLEGQIGVSVLLRGSSGTRLTTDGARMKIESW